MKVESKDNNILSLCVLNGDSIRRREDLGLGNDLFFYLAGIQQREWECVTAMQ